MVTWKKKAPEEAKDEKPFNPPLVKTEVHCVVEGCEEVKAPGQTHVCGKHMRSN